MKRSLIVVAETRAVAEDAAALVTVETEAIDAVVDWRQALGSDAPKANSGTKNNLVASLSGQFGDVAGTFRSAPHVFREKLLLHRGGCHSMECRGVIASWTHDQLTLWSSTQSPYLVRRGLARHLDMQEHDIRVIAPDVGGGFRPEGRVLSRRNCFAAGFALVEAPGKMGGGSPRAFSLHYPTARPIVGR